MHPVKQSTGPLPREEPPPGRTRRDIPGFLRRPAVTRPWILYLSFLGSWQGEISPEGDGWGTRHLVREFEKNALRRIPANCRKSQGGGIAFFKGCIILVSKAVSSSSSSWFLLPHTLERRRISPQPCRTQRQAACPPWLLVLKGFFPPPFTPASGRAGLRERNKRAGPSPCSSRFRCLVPAFSSVVPRKA